MYVYRSRLLPTHYGNRRASFEGLPQQNTPTGAYVSSHEQSNCLLIEFDAAGDMSKGLWNIEEFDMAEFSCGNAATN